MVQRINKKRSYKVSKTTEYESKIFQNMWDADEAIGIPRG